MIFSKGMIVYYFARYTRCIMEVHDMNDFRVKIVDEEGNTDIYTNATMINVDDEKIVVDYENQRAIHQLDGADEITIKRNR